MTQLQEAILWLSLMTAPNHQTAWANPITGECHVAKAWYQNQLWCNIHWGIDCKTYGPGDEFDWCVVSYTKDPFSPLKPLVRGVTHCDKDGVAK